MIRATVLATSMTLAAFSGAAQAQSAAGANEYAWACASCHGLAAHGDGPLAEYMSVEVPDLTGIAARNNGVFPMLQVIHIIDGRTGVRGHGSMMPVWGDRFEASAASDAGDYGTEVMVRGRILALATYLEAIQQ
ncbi:c-type cytochrome [Rhodobacterales bacterium HKCCSP123]|nr:c-type cytochrome [Rhodobacterales bacterium HKCCSP123]